MDRVTDNAKGSPLAVVLLEDSPLDADLTCSFLSKGGLCCTIERVETRAAFQAALERQRPDLILADYALPDFNGLAALEIARQLCPEVPFLFVTGVLGEEVAIDTLKRGATDYVVKQRLERLVPAIERALTEARERAERRRAEAALRASEERFRLIAQALEEANQRKDEFLAMMAHELRNPLAAISGAVLLWSRPNVEARQMEWSKEVIERQVRHLSRMIDDLLDVSRVTRGAIQLQKERLLLAPLVNRVCEAFRPTPAGRRQSFSLTLEAEPLWLEADPLRLEQVLHNLLSNASKYTEPGGKIALTVRREGAEVVLCVRDNGVGITADFLPRLFDLFAQADQSLARSQGGLGVGLTVARKLVELHAGSLCAASDGPGQGSEFTVRLPLLVELCSGPTADGVAWIATTRGRRVLVVDDNVDLAASLLLLLQESGYAVQAVHDGFAALEAAHSFQPEIVLLDIGLPGMDGYQVARELRRRSEARNLLLIAISGYGQEEDRRRSREAGFDHHMVKPVAYPHLLNLLDPLTLGAESPLYKGGA